MAAEDDGMRYKVEGTRVNREIKCRVCAFLFLQERKREKVEGWQCCSGLERERERRL